MEPTNQQPISDDQELAKVLAGVTQQAEEAQEAGTGSTFGTPAVPPFSDDDTAVVAPEELVAPEPVIEAPVVTAPVVATSNGGELDEIKQQALSELRPLVDKLDVSPEEKFDTYLLLLRSTDDKELIVPAHDAAKNIADEARRAQALLDIIKEIDFLSGPKQ